MPYYAQTMPGVEEIAWLEIRKRLKDAHFQRYLFAKEQNGIVVFDYSGPAADLLKLRTTEDVFMQIAYHDELTRLRRDLRGLHDLIANSETFGRAVNDYLRVRRLSAPPTYRVISRQYGKFEYSRKDLTATVWRSLKERYPRWTPVADDAQIEVWANLLGSQLLIGMRLSDRTMRHRFERKVSWGVVVGGRRELWTHVAAPVMTRLRQQQRLVLDTLVDAGVARSRSDALAWCVRLVGQHEGDWLTELREAMTAVADVRAKGPAA